MGLGNSFQREFFCYAGSAAHPSSQFGFCSSTAFSVWHFVPTPRYAADSHSPFFIFAFALAYIPCVDLGFQSAVTVTAFTTTSFTWWPGATKFISVAVQPFRSLAQQHLCLASLAWQLEPPRCFSADAQIISDLP